MTAPRGALSPRNDCITVEPLDNGLLGENKICTISRGARYREVKGCMKTLFGGRDDARYLQVHGIEGALSRGFTV